MSGPAGRQPVRFGAAWYFWSPLARRLYNFRQYSAGRFTVPARSDLVNRDLIRPCVNLFIVGGGNVGLAMSYHTV